VDPILAACVYREKIREVEPEVESSQAAEDTPTKPPFYLLRRSRTAT
jgi:hypothetical protein